MTRLSFLRKMLAQRQRLLLWCQVKDDGVTLFFNIYLFILAVLLSLQAQFPSAQFSRSVVSDFATPWTAARQASLSSTNSRSLLKLMSIESVMPSNHLMLCCPPSLLALHLSQHRGLFR